MPTDFTETATDALGLVDAHLLGRSILLDADIGISDSSFRRLNYWTYLIDDNIGIDDLTIVGYGPTITEALGATDGPEAAGESVLTDEVGLVDAIINSSDIITLNRDVVSIADSVSYAITSLQEAINMAERLSLKSRTWRSREMAYRRVWGGPRVRRS